MPIPDRLTGSKRVPLFMRLAWIEAVQRRRRNKDFDDGCVPVEPGGPKTLSGGAAAPLEFDD